MVLQPFDQNLVSGNQCLIALSITGYLSVTTRPHNGHLNMAVTGDYNWTITQSVWADWH